jgi:hypothetical protein
MCDPDDSGSSFMAFCAFVAPHAALVHCLHAHVFGDRAYNFYCLLATWACFPHLSTSH